MTSVHRIRLRGRWECELAAVNLRFSRRFHRPTGVDANTIVELVINTSDNIDVVCLNGNVLVGNFHSAGLHLKVTECLQFLNELTIEINPDDQRPHPVNRIDAEFPGQVSLEIREDV